MNLLELKKILPDLTAMNFLLPDGAYVPQHFHVTEVGIVQKKFIDCGGVVRVENVVNFQLWEAHDYDHRLAPQKFSRILEIAKNVLGNDADDLPIEVEYQQKTIGKFGLEFNGTDFLLTQKRTTCLASDSCGIPPEKMPKPEESGCCSSGGCC